MTLSPDEITACRMEFVRQVGFPAHARDLSLPTTASLLAFVADKHGIPQEAIAGCLRLKEIVKARHEFFYLCMAKAKRSSVFIGLKYGFDHTAVLYGAAKHAHENLLPSPTRFNYAKHARARLEAWRKKNWGPAECQ